MALRPDAPELRPFFLRWRTRRTSQIAKAKKQTSRGRKQDRASAASGQDYEVRYEAKKTRKSASAMKKAVKRAGSSRKKVEWQLQSK